MAPSGQTGQSFNIFDRSVGQWRQTWVDDQGGYLAFRGAWADGAMTLVGEPVEKEGRPVQMRMVFREITHGGLLWTWERGTPGGTTWTAVMSIRYTRRAGT